MKKRISSQDRRTFLRNLSFLTAGGLAAGSLPSCKSSNSQESTPDVAKNIGLQIYSIRHELFENIPAGLQRLKDIGYSTLELCTYNQETHSMDNGVKVSEFKKMADDCGLMITGAHIDLPLEFTLFLGDGGGTGKGPRSLFTRKITKDDFDMCLEFWKIALEDHADIGLKTIVQPIAHQVDTTDDAKVVCELFNKTGELMKASGIQFGYHNHSYEFKRVVDNPDPDIDPRNKSMEGDILYDLLLNGTDPSLVFFEMDVYWAVMAQCDPITFFKKNPGRFPVVHMKDRDILGQSSFMNFDYIFPNAYEQGMKEFYVELEPMDSGLSQFEGVKQSFDYLAGKPYIK